MKRIIGISCIASNRAIGINNNLIFRLKEDMQFFKETTTNSDSDKSNAIIMGKNTYHSIGKEGLPGRINCVISNTYNPDYSSVNRVNYFSSVDSCISTLDNRTDIDKIFVIGGESIYKYFMYHNLYDELLMSYVSKPTIDYGDTFFPYINLGEYNDIKKVKSQEIVTPNEKYNYDIYSLKKTDSIVNNTPSINSFVRTVSDNQDEFQYLDLIKKVMEKGTIRKTRNSNTISLFGEKMEFDISKSFPLLTTKRVFFRGIVRELLWFINAKTDSKLLESDKVNIWKGNSSREYLDSIGLNSYREGDCGPIYGFQWRHFNAEYTGPDSDYTGKGIDQLGNIINLLKNDPTSRRMFMSGWNPCQLTEMALPPCHVSYQFYVRETNNTRYLDCLMYQRSGDLFLGVPFNIASTSLLVYILGNITEINPGKINIVIGDAHIYENHIEQIKTQLERIPNSFPTININKQLTSLEDLTYEDIILKNYKPHPAIKADMIA